MNTWQRNSAVFMSDSGAGSGEGFDPNVSEGNPAAPGGDNISNIPPWAAELRESVGGLTETFRRLVEMAEKRQNPVLTPAPGPVPKPSTPSVEDDANLEYMSRSDFAKYLRGQIEREFEARYGGRIEELHQGRAQDKLTQDLRALVAQSPEVVEWRQELLELYQQFPNIPLADIYTMARGRNPSKARQIDAKYAPPPEPAAPDPIFNTAAGIRHSFTNTAGRNSGEEQKGMPLSAAIEKAWDTLMKSPIARSQLTRNEG